MYWYFMIDRQLPQLFENARDPNRETHGRSNGLQVGQGMISVADELIFLVLVGIAGFVCSAVVTWPSSLPRKSPGVTGCLRGEGRQLTL
ncbi:MAG: hypothetical protein R6V33_12250 [Pelovirga sp.]